MKLYSIITVLVFFVSAISGASPCDKKVVQISERERGPLSSAIVSSLKKDMPEASEVEILKLFKFGSWTLIYVNTKVSDETVLFYKRDPLKNSFIGKWSGAAMVDGERELEKWAKRNVAGIPNDAAKCFAWFVTKGR